MTKGVSANVYSLHIQIGHPDAHSQDNFSAVIQFSCQKWKVYSQSESCFLGKCRVHAQEACFSIVACLILNSFHYLIFSFFKMTAGLIISEIFLNQNHICEQGRGAHDDFTHYYPNVN